MQINWDEPKDFEYRASDGSGRVVGRVHRITGSSEYSASALGEHLGIYISEEAGKAAVAAALQRSSYAV